MIVFLVPDGLRAFLVVLIVVEVFEELHLLLPVLSSVLVPHLVVVENLIRGHVLLVVFLRQVVILVLYVLVQRVLALVVLLFLLCRLLVVLIVFKGHRISK